MAGHAEPLLSHLRLLIRETHTLLRALCVSHRPPPELLRVAETTTAESRSPIIPVITSRPRSLAAHCQQRGFVVRPIVAPTVPRGSERIRICLHAGNTVAQVQGLVAAVEAWLVACKNGDRRMESEELGDNVVGPVVRSKGKL
jgi:8-amino-7-oxononanoate synthase